jgi:hypothetical protein
MKDKKHFLILDANVLIDYCKSDRTIIKSICGHVGQVYLAMPVLSELSEIDEDDCLTLKLAPCF